MDIRYYHDPDTGQPHIYGHGVTEREVEEVLRGRCGRPENRGGRSARRRPAELFRSSTYPTKTPRPYSSSPRTNRKARPRRRSVADNGGSRNEEADLPARLGRETYPGVDRALREPNGGR